jgi:Ca-activated chloride channel family protein
MTSQTSKNKKKGFTALILSFICLGVICHAGPRAAMAATGSQVACRVELDRDVLPADDPQQVVVKVTLDAPLPPSEIDRPPVNLCIVLDRSASMSGQKIEKAKEAAIEALRRLGRDVLFSLVVYDHNVDTVIPAQSARNSEWIESRIRGIHPGGNTALFGGVSQGASEIRKNLGNRYVHRIILLSDGLANEGPSTPEDLGRLGAALIKEGISVTTVGVGTDYNEDLMTKLSQNSDGNAYFVESSRDLPRIFTAELGDVLNVVAKQVNVYIDCPNGVEPVRIIGRDGRIKNGTVALSLNQLYGGQEKYALVEVRVPAGKSGKDMDIARARVTYENPFTQTKESSAGSARATFSRDKKAVKASANVDVQRDLSLNRKAEAEEMAIEYFDAGNTADAIGTLKKSAEELKERGMTLQDDVLLEEAEKMEQEAQVLELEGMSKVKRKEMRTNSFQLKNQQMSK